MVKRKGKTKGMSVDGDDSKQYNYGPATGGTKKKRVIKLSSKQLKRKQQKRERGEKIADRQGRKAERDARRIEKKVAAKELW